MHSVAIRRPRAASEALQPCIACFTRLPSVWFEARADLGCPELIDQDYPCLTLQHFQQRAAGALSPARNVSLGYLTSKKFLRISCRCSGRPQNCCCCCKPTIRKDARYPCRALSLPPRDGARLPDGGIAKANQYLLCWLGGCDHLDHFALGGLAPIAHLRPASRTQMQSSSADAER